MDLRDKAIFVSMVAILTFFLSLVIGFKSHETVVREAFPKIHTRNVHWKLVKRLSEDLKRNLLINDLMRAGGRLSAEGYVRFKSKEGFLRAAVEAVKDSGKKPEIHETKSGYFFEVHPYKVVVLYEGR